MEVESAIILEKAIKDLSKPTLFDWSTFALSIFAIIFAVRIPQKIANRQDKIALFEKRYSIYNIIQKLCNMTSLMRLDTSPEKIITHLIFFYKGADTPEDYEFGSGKYNNGDGTTVLCQLESEIDSTYFQIKDSVLFLFNKDIYDEYTQTLDSYKEIIDFLNFYYYKHVGIVHIPPEYDDYEEKKKKSISEEEFQKTLYLLALPQF